MRKRDFLAAGLGLGSGLMASALVPPALAQVAAPAAGRGAAATPNARARTTKMFKGPGLYPNALATSPQGLWIGQQKTTPQVARDWNLPMPADRDEAAWLVDWNGKLLNTVMTHSRNTSGIAWGDGCVWMGGNEAPNGIFQVEPSGRQVSWRQIPLSMDGNGGGCHGLQWGNDKLWIAALRLGGVVRVDPKTWTPEVLIRVASVEKPRLHDITIDNNGDLWVITGNNSTSYADGKPGLNKYNGKTGALMMTVDFEPGSCDPHGLVFYNGKLISCDAGSHPNWKESESPTSGWIFSIDLI